ncbi:MAG: hypothetical protein V4555_05010 [Acidobacteriota bacterium]
MLTTHFANAYHQLNSISAKKRTDLALRGLSSAALLAVFGSLVGCGMGVSGVAGGGTSLVPQVATQGRVHGGIQPIVGATITLYAAGTSGYGSGASVVALSPSVVTGPNGFFSLTGKYTCPTPSAEIYIVATGGDPGTGVANPNLALMSALGPCPAGGNLLATVPQIDISEVSTVAAVWALQQFMAAPAVGNAGAPSVGAPSTGYSNGLTSPTTYTPGITGLKNAFTTASMLVDVGTGGTPNTKVPYATPDVAKINTLADILAYCVNSDPGTTTQCSDLFAAATPSGSAPATDTIQAAWYIAQNPTQNIATLYNFIHPIGAPYLPILNAPGGTTTASFNDTTVGINYAPTYSLSGTSTYAVSGAYGIAIDAYGNVWLGNSAQPTGGAPNSVTELGPDGSLLVAPITTFTASSTGGSAGQFTVAPTTTRTINTPRVVSIDLANQAWVANYGDSTSGGTPATAGTVGVFGPSTGAGVAGTGATGYFVGYRPWGMAIDGSNNIYVANVGAPAAAVLDGRSVGKMSATNGSGWSYSTSGLAGQTATGKVSSTPTGLPGAQAVLVVDNNPNGGANGFVWVASDTACSVQGNYNVAAGTNFGMLNLYTANNLTATTNSTLTTAATGSDAFVGTGTSGTPDCGGTTYKVGQIFTASMSNPTGMAVDRNNGLWITDWWFSSTGFDGVTYLGAPTGTGSVPFSTYALAPGATEPTSTTGGVASTVDGHGAALAIDGNNAAWIPAGSNSLVKAFLDGSNITFQTPTTAAVGYLHNFASPTALAVDPSGNLWITNDGVSGLYTNTLGQSIPTAGSVTVVVGAAGPVITPLSLSLKSSRLGQKP